MFSREEGTVFLMEIQFLGAGSFTCFREMLIKINFLGRVCMVNLVLVFCYINTHAKKKDNVFNRKDEYVGILRARECIHTYIHAGSAMPEILNI